MRRAALTTLVLGAVLQATAQVSDPAKAAAIVNQLQDIPTTVGRFNLFNGREYVFDFNAGVGTSGGAGGNITVANVADFPYLFGQGMALAVGKLGPCGLATPHYHPRAAEFLFMLTGDTLKVGFLQENGVRFVSNTLNPGQGAIFPKGSFHYQLNPGCEPISFVSGLNNEDPGVATVAQRFFGIPPDVVDASIGDYGVDNVVRIAKSIPDSFALGLHACLEKCKIKPVEQPKTQQQPRVGGNEFPGSTDKPKPDDNKKPGPPDDKPPPKNYNHHEPPDKEPENNWDSKEWSKDPPTSKNWWDEQKEKKPPSYDDKDYKSEYDNGQWDEKKWGDDKSKWNQGVDKSQWDEEKYGWKNYEKPSTHGGSHDNQYDDGKWDEKKWGDDKSWWNKGVDKSQWDEEKYGWKNYEKPSTHGGSHDNQYDDGKWDEEKYGWNKYNKPDNKHDNGQWDEKKWGDDKSWWNKGVDKSQWDEEKHGWNKYNKPDNKPDNGQWDEKKWGDDKKSWNKGVDKSQWDEEKYGWKNYQKRSDVPEDRISTISSLMSSANAQTLEELVFFLKLVLAVLLAGYVFVWAYFVVPAWRNRKAQVELQAPAAVSPPVPVQDVKA